MNKPVKDPLSLKKATEVIAALNEKRVELELVKEEIRHRNEELTVKKGEIVQSVERLAELETRIVDKQNELNNYRNLSKDIKEGKEELARLGQEIIDTLVRNQREEDDHRQDFEEQRARDAIRRRAEIERLDAELAPRRQLKEKEEHELSKIQQEKETVTNEVVSLRAAISKESKQQAKDRGDIAAEYANIDHERRVLHDTEVLIKALIK